MVYLIELRIINANLVQAAALFVFLSGTTGAEIIPAYPSKRGM